MGVAEKLNKWGRSEGYDNMGKDQRRKYHEEAEEKITWGKSREKYHMRKKQKRE